MFGPKKRQLIDGALLAVDVETTGLKPARSQLVSCLLYTSDAADE